MTAAELVAVDPTAARAAWLAERRTGLGGSDAAAACGMNPYKTPLRLYLEKRGEITEDDLSAVEAVRWGNRLEDVIAAEYAERTGRSVHRVNRVLRSATHPFMLANLDRRVVGERRGLEVKTAGHWAARSEEWGEPGSDVVPTHYLMQVQHYMAVTGYEIFDLAVLIGGQDFRVYEIARDETLIANLVRLEAAFWRCVELGTAPAISTVEEARERFPRSIAMPIDATAEIACDVDALRVMKAQQKALEREIDAVQARICAHLGECDTLTFCGEPIATWKSQTASRLDQKALEAEHPEIIAAYKRPAESRVFRLKGVS